VLADGVYGDRPRQRSNYWGRFARLPDARLERAADLDGADEDGGMQQQRHPGLAEDAAPRQAEVDPAAQVALEDDDNIAADQRAMDQVRNLTPAARGFGINEGAAHGDLIPGL
ncbi:MAG TPA: conjugal transfer protein TraG, partial [Sphingomonas sp.]|nr:conjugal transfer protein TraG [Sphingomonas sp.]